MRYMLALAMAAMANPAHALSLVLIGQMDVPTGTRFDGTVVGGLSGIDYDRATNSYIAQSDDRSAVDPARYYRLKITLTRHAIQRVTFTGVTTFKTPQGAPYAKGMIDSEAIRLLPHDEMVYTSEGDTRHAINAFIRIARRDGSYIRDLTLPPDVQQTGPKGHSGIRNNLAFESVTLSPDGKRLTSGTEDALRQDGPASALGIASPSRLLTFDFASGKPGPEYVYMVDPIPWRTTPPGGYSDNGLSALIDEGNGKYLALERRYIQGYKTAFSDTGTGARIYEIDTHDATDVAGVNSLKGAQYTPVTKRLILDLDALHIPLDNLEGMTFGPRLPDGSRTLILVSDNNFSKQQTTQFLAFRVIDHAQRAGRSPKR